MPTAEAAGTGASGPPAVTAESLTGLEHLHLDWPSPFSLPSWMRAWSEIFAPRAALWIRAFRQKGELLGIAPFLVEGRTARLIGDPEVCDHLDIIAAAGRAEEFCRVLLESLKAEGIEQLELEPLRPDSVAIQTLVPEARKKGHPVTVAETGVLFEMELPGSWDDYLMRLSAKQRHEVRRKIRRLEETAFSRFRLAEDRAQARSEMNGFLALFRQNRRDKAAFMDERMEAYFRLLAEYVPGLRIGFLDAEGAPAAAVLCCDQGTTRYLYNSGYDATLGHLSVGIVCKLMSIRESIARGLKRYDFLKGDETYKRQLGGRPVPVYRCRIELSVQ